MAIIQTKVVLQLGNIYLCISTGSILFVFAVMIPLWYYLLFPPVGCTVGMNEKLFVSYLFMVIVIVYFIYITISSYLHVIFTFLWISVSTAEPTETQM